MKKIYSLVLMVLLVFTFSFVSATVFATTDKIENQGATFRVKNKVEECDLGYGIKYQRDIGLSSVKSGHSTGNVAGLGSSGNIVSNQEYLQQVNWLQIAADSEAKLIPYASISAGYWNTRTVREFAAEYEEKHPNQMVIAAVNGDWFQIQKECRASVGVTISNGEYYKPFSNFGADSDTLVIDNNATGKRLKDVNYNSIEPVLTIYAEDGTEVLKIKIDKVNEEPIGDEISLYYANRKSNDDDYYYRLNSITVSDAWVADKAPAAVSAVRNTFYGKGLVTKVSGEFEISHGKFAIKTNNSQVLSLLSDNTTVRCQYEYVSEDLKSVQNAIGFPYEVMVNGLAVYPENSGQLTDSKTRKPRTIIGQKEDGTIVLAQVDGRQASKDRYGLTQMEMGALMEYYGCVDAWKFDGGGSSTMIIRKQSGFKLSEPFNDLPGNDWYVVNSPSDGAERSDGNCLLIVVDVPEVKFEVENIGFKFVEFNVDLLTLKDKYEELYVVLNGKKYLVEDNKVKIEDIKSGAEYEFFVYGKIGDSFNDLGKRLIVKGALPEPTTAKVSFNIIEKENSKCIQIYYNINNKAAIKSIEIEVNGEVYKTKNSYLELDPEIDIYDFINNMEIKVIIQISEVAPEKELIFNNVQQDFTCEFIYMEILFRNNDFLKDIFG